ncbi:hypothetical protein F9L00_09025 [Brucella anthropi]|uniref:hypothetical protein n=1 Tax=Brucella/Ochrobactrum group TaxID=2826938 RepID=UPI000F68445C|nr:MULTISPECIES: hypothetical protein [Brucella/Ochrobactrum group]KAB2762450.1 hypothetical protein F9K98_11555 [Brucella anthropi]KAB2778466.1 hypothetical protein F9L00_09025 [Brucella anthropi]MCQ9146438.1 hypothetical protein [Ochrobactrum sp. BTU2]UGQ22316.1 hypothetical protein LRL11_06330 [Brucella anthropi]UVV68675.1 hypothetical protein NW321_06120 [Brucella anthropi]
MSNMRTTWSIGAVLLMSLAGCVTVSGPQTELAMGLVCPAPTPTARQKAILDYLDKAAPSTGLDVLATEWERLDEGVRKARE